MKTPLHRACIARGLAAALLFSGLVVASASEVVDPDPELFDGTRTKTKDDKKQEETTVDDWEGANLILYDSDEEGNGKGGQGRSGYDQPGMDIAGPGGMGLPIPLAGGGQSGGGGQSDPTLPLGSAAGLPEATPTAPAPAVSANMAPPPEMAIGDTSQTIAMAQMPSSLPPDALKGETDGSVTQDKNTSSGGDEVPKAASTSQSRARGVGVEKGDAMPSDL